MTWFPIGPDFVFQPRSVTRSRLSRRNELGRQGAAISMSIGAPPTRSIYIVVKPATNGLTGSVFRSDDAGRSWQPIWDERQRTNGAGDQPATVIAHPTVDGLVYVATLSNPGRIFVSTDHGASWDGGHAYGLGIIAPDLVIVPGSAPGSPTRLFATATNDIVYSADGGLTWSTVLTGDPTGRAVLSKSLWSANGPLYALLTHGGLPAGPAGVYYCDPAQPTVWTPMAGGVGLPTFINGAVDCCQNGRVYAYLINGGSSAAVVTAAGPTAALNSVASASIPSPNAGAPHWTVMLRVPPNSPGTGADLLFVGTIELYRSTNGGQTWQAEPTGFHADQHAMEFLPAAGTQVPITYLACDGGVARNARLADPALTTLTAPANFGDTDATPLAPSQTAQWEHMNHGIQSSGCMAIASPRGYEALTYASCQDTSLAGGRGALGWRTVANLNGDGRAIAVAPSADGVAIWILNGYPFWLARSLDRSTFADSATLAALGTQFLEAPMTDQHNYVADANGKCIAGVVTSPSQQNLVVRIEPNGQAAQIHSPLPAEPLLIALDPQGSAIYCSTSTLQIFHTPNGSPGAPASADWQQLPSPPPISQIHGMAVTAQTSELFVIATPAAGGGLIQLFKVSTGGWDQQSMSAQTQIYPPTGTVKLLADPDSQDRLYLACGRRVYRLRRTAPGSWQLDDLSSFQEQDSGGLPGGYVNDLWVGKAGSHTLLRAAMPTRGVWEMDLTSAPDHPLFMRNHVADLGWLKLPMDGVASPYGPQAGSLAHWKCADIKVEARKSAGGGFYQTDPEYPTPTATSIGHTAFDTLLDWSEAMTPNTPARVHVQVHNRGYEAAEEVSVWLLYCQPSMGVPLLPKDFWARFRTDGTIDVRTPIAAPWFEVAQPEQLPAPSVTKPQVLSFDWQAASAIPAGSHYCLAAFVHGPRPYNITSQATDLSLDVTVMTNTQVGQRNVIWVTPGSPGPSGIHFFSQTLEFHNPQFDDALVDLFFDSRPLPQSATVRVRFAPETAELLGKVTVTGGRRLRTSEGALFQVNRKQRMRLAGVGLAAGASGEATIEVGFARGFRRGTAYTLDAVQQSRGPHGRVVTGGAALVFADRDEVGLLG